MSEKENIELPRKLSKESYDKILIAMFNAKAHIKAINRQDIADATGNNANNTSTALTFLKSINAVTKEGNDNKLTDLGMKYAQSIALGMLEDARVYLNTLIINNGITKKLQNFLSLNKNKSPEEIIKKIIEFSNRSINKTTVSAATTFYDLLIFANFIEIKDGSIALSASKEIDLTKEIIETQSISNVEKSKEKSMNNSIKLQINLNINLTPETNIDDLIQLIKTINESINY